MKATIQKNFSESCRRVRGSKGLDHSTFGAAGDESEGDDLYIVIRDVMIHDNLGGTADILIFRPIYVYAYMGLVFFGAGRSRGRFCG